MTALSPWIVAVEEATPSFDWETSIVALVSVIVGAVVGAFAGYFGNVALENRRRRARAAIRRKAKVYTPLRAHLVQLREEMVQDAHLESRILRSGPEVDRHHRGPRFFLWNELVEDGRATTSVAPAARDALDAVEDAVERLNRAMAESQDVFSRHGGRIYADITGEEMTLAGWPYGEDQKAIVRGVAEKLSPFSYPGAKEDTSLENAERFMARLLAERDVQAARSLIVEAEELLKRRVEAAIAELEGAMQRIADRYEQEALED